MKRIFQLIFLMVAAIAILCGQLSAQSNLVVNGGFESGFGGWLGTYGWLPAPGFALEGAMVGVVIDVSHSSVGQPMHQNIPTVPGRRYTFSFGLLSGYGRVGEFPSPGQAPVNVFWGNEFLGVFSNPSTTVWQLHQFQTIATSNSTTITFRDDRDSHWQLIDNVRVVAIPATPPIVTCSAPLILECTNGAAVGVLYAEVRDINRSPLHVVWAVDGTPYQTNDVPSGGSLTVTNLSFTANFGSGLHDVTVTVSNGQTNPATCSTTVTVRDTTPPQIASIVATPQILWPPNQQMVAVKLIVDAVDNCEASPAVRITEVRSNEPQNPLVPDWEITGPLSVNLRAKRSGKADGRTYTIVVEAEDANSNVSSASVNVTVPHDSR